MFFWKSSPYRLSSWDREGACCWAAGKHLPGRPASSAASTSSYTGSRGDDTWRSRARKAARILWRASSTGGTAARTPADPCSPSAGSVGAARTSTACRRRTPRRPLRCLCCSGRTTLSHNTYTCTCPAAPRPSTRNCCGKSSATATHAGSGTLRTCSGRTRCTGSTRGGPAEGCETKTSSSSARPGDGTKAAAATAGAAAAYPSRRRRPRTVAPSRDGTKAAAAAAVAIAAAEAEAVVAAAGVVERVERVAVAAAAAGEPPPTTAATAATGPSSSWPGGRSRARDAPAPDHPRRPWRLSVLPAWRPAGTASRYNSWVSECRRASAAPALSALGATARHSESSSLLWWWWSSSSPPPPSSSSSSMTAAAAERWAAAERRRREEERRPGARAP